MLADGHRSRSEALLLDGDIRIAVAMVMVVHPHVFSEDGAITDGYPLIGIQRTIVVEEHVVPDKDLASLVYHQREATAESEAFSYLQFTPPKRYATL